MSAKVIARTFKPRVGRTGRCAVLLLSLVVLSRSRIFAQNAGPTTPFQGRALLALSDTNMKASAYIDGKLGSEAGLDMLSVIGLGVAPKQMRVNAIPVSNSVAGPPQSLAVSPDGKLAVAIEKERRGGAQRRSAEGQTEYISEETSNRVYRLVRSSFARSLRSFRRVISNAAWRKLLNLVKTSRRGEVYDRCQPVNEKARCCALLSLAALPLRYSLRLSLGTPHDSLSCGFRSLASDVGASLQYKLQHEARKRAMGLLIGLKRGSQLFLLTYRQV